MSVNHVKRIIRIAAITVTITVFATTAAAQAATGPVKEILTADFGWEVNETGADTCLVSEKCQPGKSSSQPGGFEYPEGVAGVADGNVYVVDRGNHRVQELSSTGEFVLMFGKGVNKKGGDVCTKAEESECKAGTEGAAPGQFGEDPSSVTLDPTTGDVYVLDPTNKRVEKFTASGGFLSSVTGDAEHGAIITESLDGNLLAVGGPEGLLYVGEQGRVQEFEANGKWKGEITGLGRVRAIAVDDSCTLHEPVLTGTSCTSFDPAFGDLYVAYEKGNTIQQFRPSGQLLGEPIKFTPLHTEPEAHAEARIGTIAIDAAGRLAVTKEEHFYHEEKEFTNFFGSLYDASTGRLITAFPIPTLYTLFSGTLVPLTSVHGIAFNGNDELYAVRLGASHDVLAYTPLAVAELLAASPSCVAGAEQATDATFNCALKGEVNPYKVPSTEVWFEWGRTCSLGSKTPNQPVATVEELLKVSASIEGLRPNEAFCYRLAGEDQNAQPPEQLDGSEVSFTTPVVAPKIVGEPSASFVTSSSAVLFGELNPENAPSELSFEYGSKEALSECAKGIWNTACAGVARTAVLKSSIYGRIGATLEVAGLQSATEYAYRLTAKDEGGEPISAVSVFTTAHAVSVEAATGPPSLVTVTGATVSGTVNPGGQPATYTFELGVYNGAATQYGTVFSGPAGASGTPVEEALALSGLQSGTTYAYRIVVKSGYGTAYGASATFTTLGLPSVLVVSPALAQLPVPSIAFPKEPSKVTPKKLTRAQQLSNALKVCKTKPKKQRASCERNARKKYVVNTNAKGKKHAGGKRHG
jgi:hypothetical protein